MSNDKEDEKNLELKRDGLEAWLMDFEFEGDGPRDKFWSLKDMGMELEGYEFGA